MTALLNYTTQIDARRTLGQVQELLAQAGALEIAIRYDPDTRQPRGVTFSIATPWGIHWYGLPANAEPVYQTLVRQRQHQRSRRILATPEQAERVAWRILKDWLEAQLAIIETGMVSLSQVMLPYVLIDRGTTLFDAWVNRQALPAPEQ